MVKDPVCGMTLEVSNAAAQENHLRSTHYFCSDSCHTKFKANPSEYVKLEKTKDPVCNMDVATDSKHHTKYAEKDYYFCSSSCHDKFTATPEQFT